jgi:hypothetical protein
MRKRYQFKKLISVVLAFAMILGCFASADVQRTKADADTEAEAPATVADELWIDVDGKPDEWGLISNMADAPATFAYIKAVKTADYLYIAAKTADTPAAAPAWYMGINSDGDTATGYNDYNGADYCVLGDSKLYKNTVPDDWAFEDAVDPGFAFVASEDGSFVEARFSLSVIGDSDKLSFAMLDGGWTYVYKTGSIVPAYKAAIGAIGGWDGNAFTNNGSDGAYIGAEYISQEVTEKGLAVHFVKAYGGSKTRFWINLGEGVDLAKAEKLIISYSSDKEINFDQFKFYFYDQVGSEGRKELCSLDGFTNDCDGLITLTIPTGLSGVAKTIRAYSNDLTKSIPDDTHVFFRGIDFTGEADSGSANIIPEGENFNIDGNNSDWRDISSILDAPEGIFDRVAACFDDENVYFLFNVNDVKKWATIHIFMDSDQNAETGFQNGGGFNHLLEGTSIYESDAGEWPDTKIGQATVAKSKDGATVEVKLSKAAIGFTGDKLPFRIELVNENWSTVASYPGAGTVDALAIDEVKINSTQPYIDKFALTMPEIYSLTEQATKDGVIGTFSAEGGDGENYVYAFAFSSQYGPDNSKFRIEGDKLIVDAKVLAPGEYRIYVKVKSGDRYDFGTFAIVVNASVGTKITEDIFNGHNGEWFAVNYSTANPIPNLTQLRAAADSGYLYVFAAANSLTTAVKFYISDGITAGKDMSANWSNASDMAFMIDFQGNIYAYNNGSFETTGAKAEVALAVTGFEAKIPLSVFAGGAEKFGVACDDGAGALLPNIETELLTVTTPLAGNGPAITADGDPSEWTDEFKVGVGTGSMGDIWAARTKDYLYVMTYVDVDASEIESDHSYSTNLYIDSDGNPSTGYAYKEIYTEAGGDFLLQDWYITNQEFSYKTGNGAGFGFSHSAGGCGDNLDWKVTKQIEGTNRFCMEFRVPIAKMAAVSSLAIDDILVSVQRDATVRTTFPGVTKAFGEGTRYSRVPKYGTRFDITIDGKFADWNAIPNVVTNTAEENVYNLYATKSQYKLYTMLLSENGDLDTKTRFVINVNDSTGYSYFGFANADYVVMNGNLYTVKSKNRIGNKIKSADITYGKDSIEMRLYLEDIGSPENIKIAALAKDKTVKVPSKRYMNVAGEVDMYYADGYVYPYENFDVYNNPYKGWTAWANVSANDIPNIGYDFNLTYFPVTWDDIETVKGVFDWSYVDDKYQLEYWKENGVRVNFRFVMDTPEPLTGSKRKVTYGEVVDKAFIAKNNLTENGVVTERKIKELFATGNYRADIPAWLVADLCNEVLAGKYENAGTFYNWPSADVLGGAGFSPNYYSEMLIDRHDKMIEAFAAKFDDGSITGFAQVGSLGHWGEFHTWPEAGSFTEYNFGSGEFPDPETAGLYAKAYTDHFKTVKIGIRYPYPFAAKNGFGLFNDMFGDPEGTDMFLGAIENGNTNNMINPKPTDVADSRMPDFWKTNYSGGEFSHGDVLRAVDDDSIMDTISFIKDSHTSWLGPCSPCDLLDGDFDAYTYEANIHYLQRIMGYRLSVKSASYTPSVAAGGKLKVRLNWRNTGVAPFYYSWPVEVSLLDVNGNVAARAVTKDDIRKWMPGDSISMSASVAIPDDLANGVYTVAVAILDPDTMKPAVHLAMEGGNKDLRYGLYYITVGLSEFTKDTVDEDLRLLTGDADGLLFTAKKPSKVTIWQSTITPGTTVYVYRYNKNDNSLAEVDVSASTDGSGKLSFTVNRAGTYVVLDRKIN